MKEILTIIVNQSHNYRCCNAQEIKIVNWVKFVKNILAWLVAEEMRIVHQILPVFIVNVFILVNILMLAASTLNVLLSDIVHDAHVRPVILAIQQHFAPSHWFLSALLTLIAALAKFVNEPNVLTLVVLTTPVLTPWLVLVKDVKIRALSMVLVVKMPTVLLKIIVLFVVVQIRLKVIRSLLAIVKNCCNWSLVIVNPTPIVRLVLSALLAIVLKVVEMMINVFHLKHVCMANVEILVNNLKLVVFMLNVPSMLTNQFALVMLVLLVIQAQNAAHIKILLNVLTILTVVRA